MILYDGKLYDSSEQNRLLEDLRDKIPSILQKDPLSPEIIIDAVDRLREDLLNGKFDGLLESLPREMVASYKAQAVTLLSPEHLRMKLRTELGATDEYVTDKIDGFSSIRVKKVPLGVIFHISAGNMDFLPAYSLAEGLLTGNINILKLPSADNGLSLKLIMQFMEYRPELTDYIYVFDTSSSDIQGMRKMAELSNAISVWGSDMAIEAVRNLAPPGIKLIEWGQKLGFCYVSDPENTEDLDKEMEGLAEHIATTKQLLCSSCQVIYLDTDDMEKVRLFAEQFKPYLEKAAGANLSTEIGIRARDTLTSYTQRLTRYLGEEESPDDVIRGKGMSLIIKEDHALELSPMMCNVLIKPLPIKDLSRVLYEGKHHLQTAGLICPADRRADLTEILIRAGIVRVTHPGQMSAYFPGECHDGEYALARYVRTVNIEEDTL